MSKFNGMKYRVFEISLVLVIILGISHGKQCLKNDDIGWREGNIYNCTDPNYPACCEVYWKFTCCEEPSIKNLREQLQLWGSLFFIMMVIFIVYLYYNKDSQTLCSCNCGVHLAFERCRRTFLRRKSSFNPQNKTFTVNTDDSSIGNLADSKGRGRNSRDFQYNSFDTFTVA